MPDNCISSNCRVNLSIMQKDLPTLSFEQYESILQLDVNTIKEDKLVKNTTTYSDKLSIFLTNYLNEEYSKSESKKV